MLEHYSSPSQLPLILAALQEHQTPFRRVIAGRVETLLIEAERMIPGRVEASGALVLDVALDDPDVDDVLDDLGELVLKMKGHVVVVPAQRMPTDTGLAAVYRF